MGILSRSYVSNPRDNGHLHPRDPRSKLHPRDPRRPKAPEEVPQQAHYFKQLEQVAREVSQDYAPPEHMNKKESESYYQTLTEKMESKRKEIIEENSKYGEQWGYEKVNRDP